MGVEGPDIVIYDSRGFVDDVFVEFLSAEEGEIALCVKGPVKADAGLDESVTRNFKVT